MKPTAEDLRLSTDVWALPLVRRVAATLDRGPLSLQEGDPLPHGWHRLMFNTPMRQTQRLVDVSAHLVDLERQAGIRLGETAAWGSALVELPSRQQAGLPPDFAPAKP